VITPYHDHRETSMIAAGRRVRGRGHHRNVNDDPDEA
jgi:hypothetical protein